ncbi:MAG TPA: polysaccharide biosynthesis tyrosine autokinase [Pantanalinema sp.]
MTYDTQQHQDLISFLSRRWRVLGLTFAVVVAAGSAALPFIPKTYQATTKLLIVRNDQRMGGFNIANESLPQLTMDSKPLQTQAELIRVSPVLREVIARLDLRAADGRPLTPDQLADQIAINPIKGTDLIEVSYTARDPQRAQQVVTTLCSVYLQHTERSRREGISEGMRYVDEQLEAARVKYADTESRLQAFKLKAGSIALPQEIQASVQALYDLDQTIRMRRLDLESARARVATLRSQLGMTSRDALELAAITQNPRLRELQAQLLAAEASPLRSQGLAPDHPEMLALADRVAVLKRSIEEEIQGTLGHKATVRSLGDVQLGLLQQLVMAETEVRTLESNLHAAERSRAKLNAGLAVFPGREQQLARLSRDAEVANQLYRQLLQKREEAHLSRAVPSAYAQVVQPAELPGEPSFPRKGVSIPALFLLGLSTAFGAGLLREQLDRSLRSQELAACLPEVGIIASIPTLSRHELRRGELVVKHASSPQYVEALKALAIALEDRYPAGGEGAVLALTSSLPGEGKSVTVANLAFCLAEAGYRVLLVDGDLNRPRLHAVFGEENSNGGLAELLSERIHPQDAVRQVGKVGLVKAGKAKLNMARLKRNLKPALDEWRQAYDFVLFDLPPLGMFANVAYFAKQCDGVMLLANLQRTSREAFGMGLQQLRSTRIPLVGLVAVAQRAPLVRMSGYYLSAGEGERP